MRTGRTKYLTRFFAIVLVLVMVTSILPNTMKQVKAADAGVSLSWLYATGYGKSVIQVEKGQKFYIGDFVKIYDTAADTSGTATNFAVTYKSSKPKVGKINKKGLFTAKSVGITKVTIRYKGKKASCKFEVVETGSFGSCAGAAAMKRASKTLAKKIPTEINVKNGYKLLQTTLVYEDIQKVHLLEVNRNGFLVETDSTTNKSVTTTKLIVPQVGRYQCLVNMLYAYEEKYSPVSTLSTSPLKYKSATATRDAITVNLKRKITAEQVLAGQINQSSTISSPYELTSKKAMVQVGIYGVDVDADYVGYMCLEKGKKQATIVPMKLSYEDGKPVYTIKKLKTGKTYRIGTTSDWTKGKTVTVQ